MKMKNKWFASFWIIFLISITVLFIQGFAELIQNKSAGVIMFYGIITIFFTLQLSDFLKEPLDCLLNKQKIKGEK
jgi:hypothetical protein